MILWAETIRLTPLCAIAPLITMLSELHDQSTHEQFKWDDRALLSDTQIRRCTSMWTWALQNHIVCIPRDPKLPWILAASDACLSSWGAVVFTGQAPRYTYADRAHAASAAHQKDIAWHSAFPAHMQAKSIFHKELYAAVQTCTWIAQTFPDCNVAIAIDNKAAMACINSRYTAKGDNKKLYDLFELLNNE